MTQFVQLHLLTAYPPSNLNRDDSGRPKTATLGGVMRLRISSQSLKRAYRESEIFAKALADHLGKRTQRLGKLVLERLVAKGLKEKEALAAARTIVQEFAKLKEPPKDEGKAAKSKAKDGEEPKPKKDKSYEFEQLVFVSPDEMAAVMAMADAVAGGTTAAPVSPGSAESAADIAMFGRMLANTPEFNVEAAVQIAHAVTTHQVTVEDDYYTAVDDLKEPSEDSGAGFVGEAEFGAGVFYLYACIDRDALERNLGGDKKLADTAIAALVEAAATVAPRGKQASYASRARAFYGLVETGPQQPRSLALAFVDPVAGGDQLGRSIEKLSAMREKMDGCYGDAPPKAAAMDVVAGKGSLRDLIACATAR
jgi:CRISPR system Cascade subunit CasC